MGSLRFVIIGAGGHGQDLLSIYKAMEKKGKLPRFIGFLDDVKTGPNVIGKVADISSLEGTICYSIGINSSSERRRIDNLIPSHIQPISLIHPTASVGYNITLDSGIVLAAYSVLTTNVTLGRHVHLNVAATVSQGSSIGSYSTLSPGVHIAGDVTVGEGVSFGAGAVAINLVTVGKNTIVGAGAVIVNNIPSDVTIMGVPARLK